MSDVNVHLPNSLRNQIEKVAEEEGVSQLRELVFGVDDVVFEVQRLGGLFGFGELGFGLADVDGDADDLVVAVLFLQQRDTDCRVEPTGEGERDAFVVRH